MSASRTRAWCRMTYGGMWSLSHKRCEIPNKHGHSSPDIVILGQRIARKTWR
jgi:hypothetical protein